MLEIWGSKWRYLHLLALWNNDPSSLRLDDVLNTFNCPGVTDILKLFTWYIIDFVSIDEFIWYILPCQWDKDLEA